MLLSYKFNLIQFSIGLTTIILSIIHPVQAQVIPDTTLPRSSRVTSRGNRVEITGGTRTGNNLFHSFREFSVRNRETTSFQGIDPGIDNIFTRVIGSSRSRINGTIEALQSNGAVSSANFFLINPNGIIFGEQASLNIGGSFLATTAERINFADGTRFSTTDPRASLLSISVPVGLQFGSDPGNIVNYSISGNPSDPRDPIGLSVVPSRTLALVGGNISMLGGELTAPQGRIELGSVTSPGLVELMTAQTGWRLRYREIQNFGDIQLIDAADLDASGVGGGTIQLRGDRIRILGGSLVRADTLGDQHGGGVLIRASDIEIGGGDFLDTDQPLPSQVRALTFASGDGGDIVIFANRLRIVDGGQVTTDATLQSTGNAGSITVNASNVELAGVALSDQGEPIVNEDGIPIPSTLSTFTNSSGNAGNITLDTDRLILRDGATIQSTTQGSGNARRIRIRAAESVELSGTVRGLNIPTGLLTFSGGIPQTEDFALNPNATGSAGSLSIRTGELIIRDRAIVATGSANPKLKESAIAGSLQVTADTIRIGNQSALSTGTNAGGGGNIILRVSEVVALQQGATISTTAGEAGRGGNGGKIHLNTTFIVSFLAGNNDITANAFTGNGGSIQIDAPGGILGISPREQRTPQSDITASSERGIDGEIRINGDTIDPTPRLLSPPPELRVPLLTQICPINVETGNAARTDERSEFVSTGRGGLPTAPNDVLDSQTLWQDWRFTEFHEATSASQNTSEVLETPNQERELVEAQGWYKDVNGNVVLVADVTPVQPKDFWFIPPDCQTTAKRSDS